VGLVEGLVVRGGLIRRSEREGRPVWPGVRELRLCWGASSCERDHAWRCLHGRQKPQCAPYTPATEGEEHGSW
jgi:hypothetical protein